MGYLTLADSYLSRAMKYRGQRGLGSKNFDLTSVKCAIKLKNLEFVDKFITKCEESENTSFLDNMNTLFEDSKKIETVIQK